MWGPVVECLIWVLGYVWGLTHVCRTGVLLGPACDAECIAFFLWAVNQGCNCLQIMVFRQAACQYGRACSIKV